MGRGGNKPNANELAARNVVTPSGLVDMTRTTLTVVDNEVYDMSDFAAKHPAGADLLRLAIGFDDTSMVHCYHPNMSRVYSILDSRHLPLSSNPHAKEFLELVRQEERRYFLDKDAAANSPNERVRAASMRNQQAFDFSPDRDASGKASAAKRAAVSSNTPSKTSPQGSAFYVEVRRRVAKYFADTGEKRRGGLVPKSIALLALTVFVYYQAALNASAWNIVFAPLFGVLLAMVGLAIQHDANHGAFSENPTINMVFGATNDLIGASALLWRHQHTVSHHIYPNDGEGDDDTKVGAPLFRLHHRQPHMWHMQFQHVYGPMLYTLIGATSPLVDMVDFVQRAHASVRLHDLYLRDIVQFWGLKLVYFTYMYLIPYYMIGDWTFWFKFLLPVQLCGGFYLGSLFAVSHNNELCEHDVDDTEDWFELQCRTSANWSSDSWWWNYASGGLNCQIEHHLFPGVAHRHYPNLVPIVRQACKDFGLPYNEYPTFTSIFVSHVKALKQLGNPSFKGISKKKKK